MGWKVEVRDGCAVLKQGTPDLRGGGGVDEALKAAEGPLTLTLLTLGPLDASDEAEVRTLIEACLRHKQVTGVELSGMSVEGIEHVALDVCDNARHVTSFGWTMDHPGWWVDPWDDDSAEHHLLPIVDDLIERSNVTAFSLGAGEVHEDVMDEDGFDLDEALDPNGFKLGNKALGALLERVQRWPGLQDLHLNGHQLYVDKETLPQLKGWLGLPLTTLDLSNTSVLLWPDDRSVLAACKLDPRMQHVDLTQTFTANYAQTVLTWAGAQLEANPELRLVLEDPFYPDHWAAALAKLPAVHPWVASGHLVCSGSYAAVLGPAAGGGGSGGGPLPSSGLMTPPEKRAAPPDAAKHEPRSGEPLRPAPESSAC